MFEIKKHKKVMLQVKCALAQLHNKPIMLTYHPNLHRC